MRMLGRFGCVYIFLESTKTSWGAEVKNFSTLCNVSQQRPNKPPAEFGGIFKDYGREVHTNGAGI